MYTVSYLYVLWREQTIRGPGIILYWYVCNLHILCMYDVQYKVKARPGRGGGGARA